HHECGRTRLPAVVLVVADDLPDGPRRGCVDRLHQLDGEPRRLPRPLHHWLRHPPDRLGGGWAVVRIRARADGGHGPALHPASGARSAGRRGDRRCGPLSALAAYVLALPTWSTASAAPS